MNEQAIAPGERVVDVRIIDPGVRHTIIQQLFSHLRDGQTLQLVVDHNPRRLKLLLEAGSGGRFSWDDLESGPDVWRVRIGRGGRA
ncbi:MAG: hemerythrin [Alphaproteobacteria bacterium HGW-Alphaproteobacteria-5]|nr:MAG: hemerythrin [Alphaproteobacteria bacterium HGW-Alphaproteobacteria-5]